MRGCRKEGGEKEGEERRNSKFDWDRMNLNGMANKSIDVELQRNISEIDR